MENNWKKGIVFIFALGLGVLAIFAIIEYNSTKTPEEELAETIKWEKIHSCLPMPDDVPTKYSWGPDVRWDCTLQSAYNDGDLRITYPENGDKTTCESIEYVDHDGNLIKCDFEKITSH